jgi:hypothetical protein
MASGLADEKLGNKRCNLHLRIIILGAPENTYENTYLPDRLWKAVIAPNANLSLFGKFSYSLQPKKKYAI